MALRKLFDSIYVDTDGTNGGNHGAIAMDDEVLMIDAGMVHRKSRETRDFLESKTGLPIKKLIFTHSHSDHVFGAQAFEPVLLISSEPMYKRCRINLEHEWKSNVILERYFSVREERPDLWESLQTLLVRLPDITFDDSISIGDHKQVTAKLMGGHTSGSSIVIFEDCDVVFVGDLIFSGQFPYGGDNTCDPDRWILALEEIHAFGYKTIIPGHGPICNHHDLEKYTEALSELRQNVKDAVKIGLSVQSFIDREMIPGALKDGFDRFGPVTIEHWFNFYA